MGDDGGGFSVVLFQGLGGSLVAAAALLIPVVWRVTREHRANRRRIRAAARVLRGDYRMWQDVIAVAIESGEWWTHSDVYPIIGTVDDVRTLAENRRDWEDWKDIGNADRRLRQLIAERSHSSKPNADELSEVFGRLENARGQLSKFDGHNFAPHPQRHLVPSADASDD